MGVDGGGLQQKKIRYNIALTVSTPCMYYLRGFQQSLIQFFQPTFVVRAKSSESFKKKAVID